MSKPLVNSSQTALGGFDISDKPLWNGDIPEPFDFKAKPLWDGKTPAKFEISGEPLVDGTTPALFDITKELDPLWGDANPSHLDGGSKGKLS